MGPATLDRFEGPIEGDIQQVGLRFVILDKF